MSIFRRVVLLFLFFPAFAVHAEDAPTPMVWAVTSYTIHPGTAPIFEQVVMRYKDAAMKLGKRPTWFAYSPGIGNDLQYDFASPVTSFGMFADMSDDVATAFGAEEAKEMGLLARESVSNVESYTVRLRPDLGIAGPERTAPSEMVFSYSIIVKPGMNEAWEASMAKVIEATKETSPDSHWNTFQGGIAAPNLYGIRVNLNWVDLDSPGKPVLARLMEAYGEKKGRKMWKDNMDMVVSVETSISRFRTDLSHMPAN